MADYDRFTVRRVLPGPTVARAVLPTQNCSEPVDARPQGGPLQSRIRSSSFSGEVVST